MRYGFLCKLLIFAIYGMYGMSSTIWKIYWADYTWKIEYSKIGHWIYSKIMDSLCTSGFKKYYYLIILEILSHICHFENWKFIFPNMIVCRNGWNLFAGICTINNAKTLGSPFCVWKGVLRICREKTTPAVSSMPLEGLREILNQMPRKRLEMGITDQSGEWQRG